MLYNDLLGLRLETKICRDNQSPAEMCLKHCQELLFQMRIMDQLCPLEIERHTIMTTYFGFHLLFTLIPLLDVSSINPDLLIQACACIYRHALHLPAAAALLSGAKALCQQLRVNIPSAILQYLHAAPQWPQPNDVPLSWSVPNYWSVVGPQSGDTTIELGSIIAKWNSISIHA